MLKKNGIDQSRITVSYCHIGLTGGEWLQINSREHDALLMMLPGQRCGESLQYHTHTRKSLRWIQPIAVFFKRKYIFASTIRAEEGKQCYNRSLWGFELSKRCEWMPTVNLGSITNEEMTKQPVPFRSKISLNQALRSSAVFMGALETFRGVQLFHQESLICLCLSGTWKLENHRVFREGKARENCLAEVCKLLHQPQCQHEMGSIPTKRERMKKPVINEVHYIDQGCALGPQFGFLLVSLIQIRTSCGFMKSIQKKI